MYNTWKGYSEMDTMVDLLYLQLNYKVVKLMCKFW